MKKFLLALVLALCILPLTASAAPQVITATGEYTMGDNDSPKIAKDAARQEAMRQASEQAGVYVESYSRTQNMELTADDVKVISASVLKILDEQATPTLDDGVWRYTVTIRAEVDTDNIDLQALMAKRSELEKLQQERDELKRQNEQLLEQYKRSQGQEKEQIGARLESQYTLGEIFDRCVSYIQRGEQHRAINTLTEVIADTSVTDSPLAYAYYLRGRAYYELNSDSRALQEFASAQRTPHDNSIYPIWRVHYYRGRIYYSDRRYDEAYEELRAAYEASDGDGEIRDWMNRAYDKANASEPRRSSGGSNWGDILGAVIGGIIRNQSYTRPAPSYQPPRPQAQRPPQQAQRPQKGQKPRPEAQRPPRDDDRPQPPRPPRGR